MFDISLNQKSGRRAQLLKLELNCLACPLLARGTAAAAFARGADLFDRPVSETSSVSGATAAI